MFESESALVAHFVASLQTGDAPWGEVRVGEQFLHRSGRTDVVAVTNAGEVIAIEAKLTRWRDALHQAYRNTCFAHVSYVLLPERAATLAKQYAEEFTRRMVGLCCLMEDRVEVLLEAPRTVPLQPWLTDRVLAYIDAESADDQCRVGVGST